MVRVHLGSARASSLQPARIAPLLLAGMVAFAVGTAGQAMFPKPASFEPQLAAEIAAVATPVIEDIVESETVRAAVSVAEGVNQEVQGLTAAVAAKPENFTREVELGSGQTFTRLLTDADVDPGDALAASSALNKVFEHQKLKAGQEVMLAFSRLGTEEKLTGVTFLPEPTKEVIIARKADGAFDATIKTTPLERERFAVRAEIRSSLFETGEREGVPRAIMAALIRAYAHAVDFQRDIKAGDKFEVLYDQPVSKDGKPIGQGVIIYAALEIGGKVKPLYRVTFADGAVDYFDEKGQSVKRALLRTPIDGARVTSNFGMRRHPILGYSKMHQGVDFGAPHGTPIFAAGAGVIEEVGYKGAYGRYIRIRHNGKMQTAYAHMSRFGRGMHTGARVNQGDVIGFVGSTGRSTGPHLHFEVLVAGRQVNPMSVDMPAGRILEGRLLAQFREGQKKIRKEFASLLTKDADPALAQKDSESGVIKASSPTKAFATKPVGSCGLRGGC